MSPVTSSVCLECFSCPDGSAEQLVLGFSKLLHVFLEWWQWHKVTTMKVALAHQQMK